MNKPSHKNVLTVALILIVVGALFWWSSDKTSTPSETIKIGAVLGLSGAAATDAENIKRGLDLALEDLAQKGIEVDINYQDDKTDPKQTVSAIQYLAATYKPLAIIGPTWSYLEEAGGPAIEAAKIVAYAPADTSEFVSIRSPYHFRGAPRNALTATPVAAWLSQNNFKRVAIIVDKSAWGESVEEAYKTAAGAAGAQIVVSEALPPFSADPAGLVGSAMTKAKAAQADVILWTGYEPEAVAIIQKRTALGYQVPVVALSTNYTQLLNKGALSAQDLTGVYYLAVPPAPAFIKKFTEKYGTPPGNYADRAYDGLMLLVEAIQKAPTKDSDAIAKYLKEETNYKGYGGVYQFNENGDVMGGEWVIKPVIAQ